MEKQTIMFIMASCFWCLFAAFHGVYDAILFAQVSQIGLPHDMKPDTPHIIATLMRFAVASGIIIALGLGWWYSLLLYLAFACMFSFWHNGFYYWMRGKLDVSSWHFFSQSTTSVSWRIKLFGRSFQPFELGPWERSILFVAGVGLLFFVHNNFF